MTSLKKLTIALVLCTICVVSKALAPDYRKSWNFLENFVRTTFYDFTIQYEKELGFIFNSSDVSEECRKELKNFVAGLKSADFDAVQRLDSWGRVPSGLLDGSWVNLGAFSQCMSSTSNRYCLLFAKMPLMAPHEIEGFNFGYDRSYFNFSNSVLKNVQPFIHHFRYLNVTSGLCLPRLCQREEIKLLAQKVSDHYKTGMQIDVDMCQTRDLRNSITFAEAVSLLIIGSIIALNIIGIYVPKTSFLYNFNFINNLRKLLKPRQSQASVPCLDGLKALNMFFMLFVHSGFAILYQNFTSSFRLEEITTHPVTVSTIFGPFTMEVFFLITGLETTILFLQSRTKISGLLFLFLRWARFVPCIGFIIVTYIVLFSNHVRDYIGGPYWNYYHATGSIAKLCPKTWWGHLLLIQHYFVFKEDVNLCLTPDWYLEADFFFAAVFVLTILPLIRRKKLLFASALATVLVVLGAMIVGIILDVFNVQHSWLPLSYQQEKLVKFIVYIHIRPWGHLSAYFGGVVLGFILQSSKIKLSKASKLMFWLIWLLCLLIVFFYEVGTNLNLIRLSYPVSLFYGSFSKVFFSYIFAWLIYACHKGLAYPSIAKFLSARFFSVFSRINLSAMFVNALVYRMRNATFHTSVDASLLDYSVSVILPMIILIYIISFLFCALIEVPSVNIMKALFMGNEKMNESTKQEGMTTSNELQQNFPLVKNVSSQCDKQSA